MSDLMSDNDPKERELRKPLLALALAWHDIGAQPQQPVLEEAAAPPIPPKSALRGVSAAVLRSMFKEEDDNDRQ
ncbi:hypothetical protein LTR28_006937 [Elasticomyces elasticus]|nr:hypothetical protein LTR28_006937 [Elasticomyces elasticus]